MSENEKILNDMFSEQSDTGTPDDVIVIVDRSGSMGSIKDDAEGGVNAFIAEQKKVAGGAKLTLAEFDNHYNLVHDRVDINLVEDYELQPGGMTALLDGIGMTLNRFVSGGDTKKVVVIVTDGGENASQEYNREQIFEMITNLKEEGWQVMFLAANQDAIAAGGSLGINAEATINFASTGEGAHDAYAAAATYATSLRTKSYVDAVQDLDNVKMKSRNIS